MPGGSSCYNVLSMGGKMKEIFQKRKFNSLHKTMLKHKTNTKEWRSGKILLIQYCKIFKYIMFITSYYPGAYVGDIVFEGDIPENKRGRLKIFRNKRIIVLCIGSGRQFDREFIAFKTV
jgi:hypothetical protein